MKKIMIAGTMSGCGKTTVTCAVMRALVKRGLRVSAFKCGPDYIDPMFHRRVTGTDAHNLDSFFCDDNTLRYIFSRYSSNADISVAEGVMGFYDGAAGAGSSHSVSQCLDMPVIAVINARGMSESIGAVIKGFLTYKENNIIGFIFNRLPESLISQTKKLCEDMGTRYFGRFPKTDFSIESRHLGLIRPEEISDLTEKADMLAALAEEHIDLDGIISSDSAMPPYTEMNIPFAGRTRTAVAMDEAFCFMYPENMDILRDMGAETVYFSPLHDKALPDCDSLILCGGYPELYAEALSENVSMRESIRTAVQSGMPCIAECGGFMYLHQSVDGYPMAGVIDGSVHKTGRLSRFGYIYLTDDRGGFFTKGLRLPAHEFHYCESDNCGTDMSAEKPWKDISYRCMHSSDTLFAGFPHIYMYSCPEAAEIFMKKSIRYGQDKTDSTSR